MVAGECLQIAKSSIDAVQALFPWSHDQTERYFSTLFLTGVITTLSCIIVKADSSAGTRSDAATTLGQAVALLEGMSGKFVLARHILQRFQGVITIANKVTASQRSVDHEPLPDLPGHEIEINDDRLLDLSQQLGSNNPDPDLALHQLNQPMVSHMPTPTLGDQLGMWEGLDDSDLMPMAW